MIASEVQTFCSPIDMDNQENKTSSHTTNSFKREKKIKYFRAYHSVKLVARAAMNPCMLKLSSYAEQRASPPMIGMSDKKVQKPVYSPISTWEMKTVNKGAELLTVSVKDTATYFRATRPSTTVENLQNSGQSTIIQKL